ncbi:hypothetical protein ACLF6K_22890 [Streptomyces xanthophaeus]|uniref:hypothetical protein n=1 Tax=Streptomyces xanthophaeus TaxID=67385 RepID=UPI00398FB3D3
MAEAEAGDAGQVRTPVREQVQVQEQAWARTAARVQERLQARYQAPPEPSVHGVQRAIAGGALLLGGLVLLWGAGVGIPGAFVLPFAALIAPVLVRDHTWFRRVCLGVALVLLPAGVLLYLVGMFLMIPSAVLLLLARGADPRRSPSGARVRAGIAGLLGLLTAALHVYALVAVASSG